MKQEKKKKKTIYSPREFHYVKTRSRPKIAPPQCMVDQSVTDKSFQKLLQKIRIPIVIILIF